MTDTTYDDVTIPTYVINLKERKDRLKHVLHQFHGRSEFDLNIVESEKHKNGAFGLWKNIVSIINQAIINKDDVILICEDDHTFTKNYCKKKLFDSIIACAARNVLILSGGIGGFGHTVPITSNLFWINWFYSTQFIILYRPIFNKIISYEFIDGDTADGILSKITSHKMVLYPFFSIQTEFGYSDVTIGNNINGIISDLFIQSEKKLELYRNVYNNFTCND